MAKDLRGTRRVDVGVEQTRHQRAALAVDHLGIRRPARAVARLDAVDATVLDHELDLRLRVAPGAIE